VSEKPWLGELSAGERAEALWDFAADDAEMLTQIADAIRDAEQRAAASAQEAAAKVCDAFSARVEESTSIADAKYLARAIRALKP
jgi:hypothetical protein